MSWDLVAWNLPSEAFATSWNRTFSKIEWIRCIVCNMMKFLSDSGDTRTSLCFANWYLNNSSTVFACSSHEPSTYDCKSCLAACRKTSQNNTFTVSLLSQYCNVYKFLKVWDYEKLLMYLRQVSEIETFNVTRFQDMRWNETCKITSRCDETETLGKLLRLRYRWAHGASEVQNSKRAKTLKLLSAIEK